MGSIAANEPVKVAALQMTSAADVTANLEIAARLLAEARAAGARVAVLPENFSFMGLRDVDKRADTRHRLFRQRRLIQTRK